VHVLQVVGNSDLGIAENHVFQLATTLKARGVRVDVVCPRPGPLTDRLQRAGIEPIVVSILVTGHDDDFGLNWPAVQTLTELCRRLRPDLVHTHLYMAALHGVMAAREARVRTVIHTAHTLDVRSGEVLLSRLGGCHLIALTRASADQLERAGVARNRMTVVYKGVASLQGSPAVGRRLPPMYGVVVGSLAAHASEGGLDLLFRAAAAWRASLPAFTLLVAGEGPAAPSLRQLAVELGLQARIAFADGRADRDMLLSAMDVCVLPSSMEACPTAVLEAMVAGKAVIAPDIGGVDELLHSGQEGLLVRPEDAAALTEAVVTLANDAALRTRLGTSARRRVASDFTVEHMADRTLGLYGRLVSAEKFGNDPPRSPANGTWHRQEQPLRALPNDILDPAAAP
jgi:glycosyltransferase involved in cell wall biosynthesis